MGRLLLHLKVLVSGGCLATLVKVFLLGKSLLWAGVRPYGHIVVLFLALKDSRSLLLH